MKRIIPTILIFILLAGCKNNNRVKIKNVTEIISINDIEEYQFKDKEEEILKDIGVLAKIYKVDLSKIEKEDEIEIFIDKYIDGKFNKNEMQISLSNFLELNKERLVWSRTGSMENQNEIWRLTFKSGSTSKNIKIGEGLVLKAPLNINDSRNLEKDKDIYLSGLICTDDTGLGFRSSVDRSELMEYINKFDITYVLGLRVK